MCVLYKTLQILFYFKIIFRDAYRLSGHFMLPSEEDLEVLNKRLKSLSPNTCGVHFTYMSDNTLDHV